MDSLAQKAVQAALCGQWKEAVNINSLIIEHTPDNAEALNRLARAHNELGNYKKALSLYKRVLKIDRYNTIADKAIERLSRSPRKRKKDGEQVEVVPASGDLFIEEPGKTKAVSLIHLGDKSIITNLDVGDHVQLVPHAHRVSAQTLSGKYIGRLPDDLSYRLIKFLSVGNEYACLIRSVTPLVVRVFIRELKRAPSVCDIPSFPSHEGAKYTSFTPPELVREDKPETHSLEDEIAEQEL